MKRHASLCALLLGLALAGCGTIVNQAQYQVVGPKRLSGERASVTTRDRDAVREIVQKVATEFSFEDRTQNSMLPGVIAVYVEPVELYSISMIGWVHDQTISVDLSHQPYTVGETQRYQQVRDRLFGLLREKFGERVLIPARKQVIRQVQAPAQ